VPHVSKNEGCNNNVRVRRNQYLPLAAREKTIHVGESLTDLVGSAMCAPVNSGALARRRALVKRMQVRKPHPQYKTWCMHGL
jgi:hypothetical protein